MDEKTARDMDRLLAGGELSGPEADAILERVHEALERKQGRRRPRVIGYWAGAAGAAVAAAAAVMLVVVREPQGGTPESEEGVMGGRPAIEIRCEGGTLQACPVTGALLFVVKGNRKTVLLSAYAEPVAVGSDGERERVVYFEKEGGGVKIAAVGDDARVSEWAVRLVGRQAAGRYRVHAFVGERLAERSDGQAAGGGSGFLARASAEMVITE